MVNPTTTSKETFARILMNTGSAELKIRKKRTPPRLALFPKDYEDTIIRMFKSKTYEETLNEVNTRIGENEFFVDGNDYELYNTLNINSRTD
ncbi:hypothetical protein bcgnr5372_26390 [Bacillus luti]|nr:hypothetical protein [Bacillus cereus]HDR8329429.1 hypothetical protein [Bacillus cereus]HDR8335967.1 hypothetical protein [Bacillus cereus]